MRQRLAPGAAAAGRSSLAPVPAAGLTAPAGITSVTTADGRFTVLMPHTERVHRAVQMSWHPEGWGEGVTDGSPWMRVFQNARRWLG